MELFCCCGGNSQGEDVRIPINSPKGDFIRNPQSKGKRYSKTLTHENRLVELDPSEVLPFVKEETFVAEGRFGEIYKGVMEFAGSTEKVEVAIKRFRSAGKLTKENTRDFFREVEYLSKLNHPNILKCFGASTKPPHLFLVMEYASRGSLFDFIATTAKNPVDWAIRLRWAAEIAGAMVYLHTRRPLLVHRDLKSLNILVFEDMHLSVCDFGLSRSKEHTFISTQSFGGSPAWSSPEVLRGDRYNHKSDVYSFAVILWELLTYEKPWSHGEFNFGQLVGLVGFKGMRPPLPRFPPHGCPAAFITLIQECWANDPKDRPEFPVIWESLRQYANDDTRRATDQAINEIRDKSPIEDLYDSNLGLGLLNPNYESDSGE